MKAGGHLVANHTFSHQPRNLLHTQRLIDEIKRTDAVLAELGTTHSSFSPALWHHQSSLSSCHSRYSEENYRLGHSFVRYGHY